MQRFTINLWRYCGPWCHEFCQQNSLAVPEYCSHHFSVWQCLFKFLGLVGILRVHPLFRLLFGLHSRTVPKSRHQSRFCQEIRPLLPSSAEEPSRLTPFFEFCEGQSVALVPTLSVTIWYKVVLEICGNSLESSDIVKRWFPRMHWSNFWTSSSVTVECHPWPPSTCTSVCLSLNFLHHSLTLLSLVTLSPYTWHNRQWILAALCLSLWRKRIIAHTSQLAGAAMIVFMFYQSLLLHCAAKIYEGTHTARTEVTCYYWACALTLWQSIYFYQPIGGWFLNSLRICDTYDCTQREWTT